MASTFWTPNLSDYGLSQGAHSDGVGCAEVCVRLITWEIHEYKSKPGQYVNKMHFQWLKKRKKKNIIGEKENTAQAHAEGKSSNIGGKGSTGVGLGRSQLAASMFEETDFKRQHLGLNGNIGKQCCTTYDT